MEVDERRGHYDYHKKSSEEDSSDEHHGPSRDKPAFYMSFDEPYFGGRRGRGHHWGHTEDHQRMLKEWLKDKSSEEDDSRDFEGITERHMLCKMMKMMKMILMKQFHGGMMTNLRSRLW